MKLSISNIAWSKENDEEMYEYISKSKFDAIEIAPTRIIENEPYVHIKEAKEILQKLYKRFNLEISSMQSIWFGKTEKIFESKEEREFLIEYTKKGIDFASSINCKNLVFGCPKNRVIKKQETDYKIALEFFNNIGNYAKERNVYFSIEPNPTIYNTNFINTTKEAIDIVRTINNQGIRVNLDLGTIIQNNEDIDIVKDNIDIINHIHISEPNLEYIKNRNLHRDLIDILRNSGYNKYISIEMKNQNDITKVKEAMNYLEEIL